MAHEVVDQRAGARPVLGDDRVEPVDRLAADHDDGDAAGEPLDGLVGKGGGADRERVDPTQQVARSERRLAGGVRDLQHDAATAAARGSPSNPITSGG